MSPDGVFVESVVGVVPPPFPPVGAVGLAGFALECIRNGTRKAPTAAMTSTVTPSLLLFGRFIFVFLSPSVFERHLGVPLYYSRNCTLRNLSIPHMPSVEFWQKTYGIGR